MTNPHILDAHPAYKDLLSRDAVVFIFSKSFHDALRDKANNCPRIHGVSAEKAIEEFRRLLAIKTWTVDFDATKISPTPISKFHSEYHLHS